MITSEPSHQQEIVVSIRILIVDNQYIGYFFCYNLFVLIIRIYGYYQLRNLVQ